MTRHYSADHQNTKQEDEKEKIKKDSFKLKIPKDNFGILLSLFMGHLTRENLSYQHGIGNTYAGKSPEPLRSRQ